jgi:16S rRNA G1207 methylase RsmC
MTERAIGVLCGSAVAAARIRRSLPAVHAWTWGDGLCGRSFDAIIIATPADSKEKQAEVACLFSRLRPGGELIQA